MLVQNGFAMTDEEYDKKISEVNKQIVNCNKEAKNHLKTGDVNICLKALKMEQQIFPHEKSIISDLTALVGLLYDESKGDKLKAYEYYMKAAKLGNIDAQKNLSIMCKNNPWACK